MTPDIRLARGIRNGLPLAAMLWMVVLAAGFGLGLMSTRVTIAVAATILLVSGLMWLGTFRTSKSLNLHARKP